jgi:peptidylamidoglycolate lyase
MRTSGQLFPRRWTRRDFVKTTAVAALASPWPTPAQEPPPARIGSGRWTYTLDEHWGRLPDGMSYGFGCGIVADAQDRIYVTSRSTHPCVAVFDPDGRLLETWSDDFAGRVGYTTAQVKDTAHGIYWSREGRDEFLYFTENAGTNQAGTNLGRRVYKTDLRGNILYTIGNVEQEGSTAQKFDWTNPTDVAVAPNGDIYVVDGYGSQRVSRFDRNFRHLKTIGARTARDAVGPRAPHGTFNTCHGVWINTLRKNTGPEVYIADRHNNRIEVFDLELNYRRTLAGDVRNPCCFYQHQGQLYVPDLASRVTIFDADDNLVAQLGDGQDVPNGGMKASRQLADAHPDKFFAPHAMCVDSHGDLYVVEWVNFGRPRKFQHTPVAA